MTDPHDSPSQPGDDVGQAVDPWARGGSMSTTWARSPRPGGPHSPDSVSVEETAPDTDAAMSSGRSGRDTISSDPTSRFGGRWLPTAVALGLIVVVVAIVASPRGDESSDDDAIDEPQTEAPIVADADADSSGDEGSGFPGATQGGTGLPDRATGVESPADAGAAAPSGPTGTDGSGQIETIIDIAPELDGIAPVEVVALHAERGLVELSLPSGRLRTTDTGVVTPEPTLAVTDFGALLFPAADGAFEVIAVDGNRFVDSSGAVLAVSSTGGLDRFYIWPDPQPESGQLRVRPVTAAGRVAPGGPVDFGESDGVIDLVDPTGDLLLGDAGGTYRIDEVGIGRLTTGDVIATGRNHVLVRECNETRQCGLATIDTDGNLTALPAELPLDARPVVVDGLSPAGDALLMFARRIDPEIPPEMLLIDLTDGSRRTVRKTLNFDGSAAWANDSSGVFFADVVLQFFDRATGNTIPVSGELPKVRSVHTRLPARSPTCELLSIAVSRFEEMRAAADGSISPPSDEVLKEILRIAPLDLAIAAEPLVAYIGAFVTSGQPESQRIENLPADIQDGLAALEDYAGTEC